MADYRRFIAYVYEYTNGRKNKNTGFTKVESRNGICKLQVKLQNIPQEEESISIYGVVREAAWLLGIFLGRVSVESSTAEIQITTPASGIGDTEYTLDQISGLWIKGLHGGLYITIWDDEPVDIKRFVLELPTRPGSKPEAAKAQSEEQAKVMREESPAAGGRTVEPKVSAQDNSRKQESVSGEMQAAEQVNKTEDNCVTEETAGIEPRPEPELKLERKPEPIREPELKLERKPEPIREPEPEPIPEPIPEPEPRPEPRIEPKDEQAAEPVEHGAVIQENRPAEGPFLERESAGKNHAPFPQAANVARPAGAAPHRNQREMGMQEAIACPLDQKDCPTPCNPTTSIDKRWQCLSQQYQHMDPFEDDEIEDCISIAPKDLSILRQNTWKLGRNSFLMHGYYNYHHILLGKCKKGGYIIAVPGIYENQESFMASMFGFPHFKKGKEQNSTGLFGYWYRPIE